MDKHQLQEFRRPFKVIYPKNSLTWEFSISISIEYGRLHNNQINALALIGQSAMVISYGLLRQ